jgi:hypothetical protein
MNRKIGGINPAGMVGAFLIVTSHVGFKDLVV